MTLPAGAVLWSASLAGKPVRPGEASDGSLLLPLEKSRAGEDAPEFAVELVYLGRAPAWDDKGKARVSLPAVDLPISRTGLMLFYPPTFKVTPEPGSFRIETYEEPLSAALSPADAENTKDVGTGASGVELHGRNNDQLISSQNNNSLVILDTSRLPQSFLDEFKAKSLSGRSAGILPIKVSFPAFGPSLFMVSELTAENQAPAAELSYQREKKGSAR